MESEKMIFNNPDGTKTMIEYGASGFLDKFGFMHNADEIPNLFEYSDDELDVMDVEITFLGDELIDYHRAGSLENYLFWLKQVSSE